jgi:membrane protease YdiL (CAAX protease family)
MNTKPARQNQGKDYPMFDKKKEHIMITTLDRRRIYIFVAIAYSFSMLLAVAVFLTGGLFVKIPGAMRPGALILMAVLMLVPAIASVTTRLITREGWSNMLVRPRFRGGWPYYLVGWIAPALAIIVGGVFYYLLFPAQFDPSMSYSRQVFGGEVPANMTPWTILGNRLLVAVVATLPTLPIMLGEELGWRGYLLPKLMPLGGRKAVLLTGVIHGAWHWPFFPMGYNYGFDRFGLPLVAAALLYLVLVIFLSTFFAWVTLRSGTVWPAALGHGTMNNTADAMVNFMRTAPDSLVGPAPLGIVGMLGFALLALPIFFSARALAPIASPAPADEPLSAEPGVVEQAARA